MTLNISAGAASAPSGVITNNVPSSGVLNLTALNGGTPTDGAGQLIAAGLGRLSRPATPAAMMKSWADAVKARVAPGATQPAGFGKAPVMPAPNPSKSGSVPGLFNNQGGKTWKVPGVPEFKGQIRGELMVGLDQALTPRRMQVFDGLSEGQQITARTLIGAALDAMSLPAGSAGRIDPKHMGAVVETALKHAQQTPTALDSAAKPGASIPTTEPVPSAPAASMPTTKRVAPAPAQRAPATSPPSGRIDKASARAKAQTLDARETTLLHGLHRGEQGAAIARAQGWSKQQFVAVRDSALHKLGVKDVRAAIKVAEAGGLLSTKAALPPEVARATAQYDQSAWRETILSEPPFAGVHLPPAQKQLFFTWIDNKMDLQGTVAALGKPAASTQVMLNKLAHRFGLSVAEMKTAVKAVVTTPMAEAPTAWPEAARQRFALLRDNAKVQRAQLTPRDIQLLSFWTHSAFKRGESASVLGLTAESMSVRLSRLSQALGFETGAAGQRGFKRFLTETTGPKHRSTAKADAASLLPPRGARYGNMNLSIGGLAWSLPGLNVNPLRSGTNCIGAAVALDRQRGGAPASALAIDVSDPADLYTLYGKLPEQGFGAHVNGDYLLPPYERFDMASLQRYVASLPNSARGILLVHYGTLNAGHALVVEKVNGRVVFLDGQSGLVVDPKAISSGAVVLPQMAGSRSAASHLADLPDVSLEFLRTDSVTRLNPLPKGTRQGVVVEADLGAQRVRVVDTTRVRGDEWVDVSGDPDFLSQIRPGENVFVVDDAVAGRTMHTYLIPQSAMPGY